MLQAKIDYPNEFSEVNHDSFQEKGKRYISCLIDNIERWIPHIHISTLCHIPWKFGST